MLNYAVVFFVITLVASLLGFVGIVRLVPSCCGEG